MATTPLYRRRWFRLTLGIHLVLLVLLLALGGAWYSAWIRQPAPGPVWQGPLTAQQRREVFDALWQTVDRRYSYLKIKQIDWDGARDSFWPRAAAATDDEAFYRVLQEMLGTLRDGHTALSYPGAKRTAGTALKTGWVGGRPVVLDTGGVEGVWPGDAVLAVDGRPVAELVDAARLWVPASTEVNLLTRLGAAALEGPAGSNVTVAFERPDGSRYSMALLRGGRAPVPRVPVAERRVEAFGYIAVRDLWEHDVVDGFDAALEKHREAPGLILDFRGNGGGNDTYAEAIVGRLLTERTRWSYIQMRFWPFRTPRISRWVSPRGPWQYTGPVVVLTDGAVFSSADFLVGGLARSGRVTVVGEPTGGGDGNPRRYPLPGGAVVRVSQWVEWFADGTVVEGNGTKPDVVVAPTVADVATGRDPVLERAVRVLSGEK